MNNKEIVKKLKDLNSLIEDFLDNMDMAEAEQEDDKSEKKED